MALEAIAPDARVIVVPAGIDLDAFRPPDPPTSAPVVVFCGVMNYAAERTGRQLVRDGGLAARAIGHRRCQVHDRRLCADATP